MGGSQGREVEAVFDGIPVHVRKKVLVIRDLILRVGVDNGHLGEIQESLKWGEPSYSCAKGSAVRLGWKARAPNEYKVLFNCQTKLVATFKELYPSSFRYDANPVCQ